MTLWTVCSRCGWINQKSIARGVCTKCSYLLKKPVKKAKYYSSFTDYNEYLDWYISFEGGGTPLTATEFAHICKLPLRVKALKPTKKVGLHTNIKIEGSFI